MGQKRYENNLYDIWKMGAPTPDSIIRDPKHYNPEYDTTVKRIIPMQWLYPFLKDVADARGIQLSYLELKETLEGTL